MQMIIRVYNKFLLEAMSNHNLYQKDVLEAHPKVLGPSATSFFFFFHILDLGPSVNSLGPNFCSWPKVLLFFGVPSVLYPKAPFTLKEFKLKACKHAIFWEFDIWS